MHPTRWEQHQTTPADKTMPFLAHHIMQTAARNPASQIQTKTRLSPGLGGGQCRGHEKGPTQWCIARLLWSFISVILSFIICQQTYQSPPPCQANMLGSSSLAGVPPVPAARRFHVRLEGLRHPRREKALPFLPVESAIRCLPVGSQQALNLQSAGSYVSRDPP